MWLNDKAKITDPAAKTALAEYKLKLIDIRRAEIDAALSNLTAGNNIDTFKAQELKAELRVLEAQRLEAELVLSPAPPPARSPETEAAYAAQRERDRTNLLSAIRARTQSAVDWSENSNVKATIGKLGSRGRRFRAFPKVLSGNTALTRRY